MGQRGPKPKPLRVVAGAVGPASGKGRARRGNPDRPRELKGEAARVWDGLAVELDAAGWLSVVDRGVLAAYCCAVAQMLWAEGELSRTGAILVEPIQTAKGEKIGERRVVHPAVKLHNDAAGRVQRLAESLGLTPASRARLEGDAGSAEAKPGNRVSEIAERIKAARGG